LKGAINIVIKEAHSERRHTVYPPEKLLKIVVLLLHLHLVVVVVVVREKESGVRIT
jgi:hypothetical protein